MFRRRTDFSWPLILVLVGLFFLSLRLPRQWERIARPTALVLKPHKSLPAKELQRPQTARSELSPPGDLSLGQANRPGCWHTDGLDSAPIANDEIRPPWSCLTWSRIAPERKLLQPPYRRRTHGGYGYCGTTEL